ncbi:hypothetical protein K439DRAFT_1623184 [Ramaria rubella]|nr:hypothetical protein K439DRAFT_1623184 [Ramaria rubella]
MGSHSSVSAVKKARTARNKAKKQVQVEGFQLPIIPELEDEAMEVDIPSSDDQGSKQDDDYKPDEDVYEEEDMVVDDNSIPKKKGKAIGFVVSDNVTFYVCQGYHMTKQCIVVLKTTKWEQVLQALYKNIGCDQVCGKPQTLQWKISDRSKSKARIMSLENEAHWADLKFEIEQEEIKKKGQMTVDVSLPEGYLDALQMRLIPNYKPETNKGAGPPNVLSEPNALAQSCALVTSPSNAVARLTNEPAPAFAEPFSGQASPSSFQDAYRSIIQYLRSCTPCPHKGAFCANKAHVWFTSALVKAWAHVLAAPGVTVQLLVMTAPLGMPQANADADALNYAGRSWWLTGAPKSGHPIASHDLSNIIINGNKEYPLIDTLFEELKCNYPRCDLGILLQKLTDGGMRTINEFTLWSENELVGTFKVSAGETQWVLKEVKNALKMVQEI